MNGFDGRRIERLAQVDVADLGADMGREPDNILVDMLGVATFMSSPPESAIGLTRNDFLR